MNHYTEADSLAAAANRVMFAVVGIVSIAALIIRGILCAHA